ncbi:Alpha,alpha-trehalose-phosphate synthase [UDP-forming] A [Hypsizygus marmoreus]|uniref:Alpha,alpha-trehalose-phosphate synthase [UDP-forming] A n=1 Tax=Hypsizygus marmoreus TaxID=39966 RepID=A0A369JZT4_HYPMA|nr:Alpha,alpha-trehalose-phosphate synthase [UDP-forming] A [Hypsizygus marmoreus]
MTKKRSSSIGSQHIMHRDSIHLHTHTPMDSFSEPYTRQGDDISLDQVRADIRQLEQHHRENGIPLSGRVLHVVHYLPVVATLNTRAGVLSPPPTPPVKPADAATDSPEQIASPPAWTLAPRYGHAAMISGIESLSSTHEQLIIGWTGDILSPTPNERISSDTVDVKDRVALEEALAAYQPKESEPDDDKKMTYVPVWLDDKVAHGHYDGYCKQTLWPLFHYLLWQDVATEYASADTHYPYYESANAEFARKIAEVYRPGDLIWVHDYHLLLVPRLVRESIPDVVLGLFMHTPFPSSEVFRCLPRRKEILDGCESCVLPGAWR